MSNWKPEIIILYLNNYDDNGNYKDYDDKYNES